MTISNCRALTCITTGFNTDSDLMTRHAVPTTRRAIASFFLSPGARFKRPGSDFNSQDLNGDFVDQGHPSGLFLVR